MINQEPRYFSEPVGATKKEPLQSTLVDAAQCLGECESILREIFNKLHGPTLQTTDANKKEPNPAGISGIALDIRNRAQQIRSVLGELAEQLG
jgi:hypothetical protein